VEEAVDLINGWFLDNFEDPVHSVSYIGDNILDHCALPGTSFIDMPWKLCPSGQEMSLAASEVLKSHIDLEIVQPLTLWLGLISSNCISSISFGP
jgi:hypothetical protein